MASWIIHLRVADACCAALKPTDRTAFLVGSLAPDCGRPTDHGFDPPKRVTHWNTAACKHDVGSFLRAYPLSDPSDPAPELRRSFLLGYACHLLTDDVWVSRLVSPLREEYPWAKENPLPVKRDYLDGELLWLRKHAPYEPLETVAAVRSFPNRWLPYYDPNVITDGLHNMVAYYRAPHDNLDREYPYISAERLERTIRGICETLPERMRGMEGAE